MMKHNTVRRLAVKTLFTSECRRWLLTSQEVSYKYCSGSEDSESCVGAS